MEAPKTPWRWQDFGGRLMLVTDHSGAQVVLAGGGDCFLVSRDARGVLAPFDKDSPLAQFVLKACNLHAELADALADMRDAADALLAAHIAEHEGFMPSKSPLWPAFVQAKAVLDKVGK